MMNLKQMLLAVALSVSVAAPAFANEAPLTMTPQAVFSETDLQALFEQDAQPMQLAALSPAEMGETEGAFWPWVIRGGVMGTIGGVGNALNSYNNGARGWAVVRAGGIGFAVGATGGVASKWLGNRRW